MTDVKRPVIIFTDEIAGLSVEQGVPTKIEGTSNYEQKEFLHVVYESRGEDVYPIATSDFLFVGYADGQLLADHLGFEAKSIEGTRVGFKVAD